MHAIDHPFRVLHSELIYVSVRNLGLQAGEG